MQHGNVQPKVGLWQLYTGGSITITLKSTIIDCTSPLESNICMMISTQTLLCAR